ncbi:MAG: hypothetical protein V4475_02275 [Pseudomonadota bacterium]
MVSVMVYRSIWLAGFAVMATAPAAAREAPTPVRAALLQHVVDCRAITDDTKRLACFDTQVAALDAAEKNKQLVVVDREQVRAARRTLFGLPLPNLHIFGGNDDRDANAVTQIEGKIASASAAADGWRIKLDDGSVWEQTDGKPIFRSPRPGMAVVVQHGAMGAYFLSVAGAPGVKVRRVL